MSISLAFCPTQRFAATMLTGADITCIRGDRLVFSGLSFAVSPGQTLLLTGPNGSGKSSLLRMLAGFLKPAMGALCWDNRPILSDRDAHNSRIAWLGHENALKPWLNVRENLDGWARLTGANREKTDDILRTIGLFAQARLPARILSAGQKRRLALARLLTTNAPLWLMDEPTTALDQQATSILETAITDHCQQGGMAVVATHLPMALPATIDIDFSQLAA